MRLIGGTPMLVHAVHALAASRAVDLVVVAAPESEVDEVRALLAQQAGSAEVVVVTGGATRQESVARALLSDGVRLVEKRGGKSGDWRAP